jgi:hypothetical protein
VSDDTIMRGDADGFRPMNVSLHCDERGCRSLPYQSPTRYSNDPEQEIILKRAEAKEHGWSSRQTTKRLRDYCPACTLRLASLNLLLRATIRPQLWHALNGKGFGTWA